MSFILFLLRRALPLALIGGLSTTIAKPIFELSEPSPLSWGDNYNYDSVRSGIINISADGTLATISSELFGGPPHIVDIASGKEIDTKDFPMDLSLVRLNPVYLSNDGKFITGNTRFDSDNKNYRYNLNDKILEIIDDEIKNDDFSVYGISPDGSVVVGRYHHRDGGVTPISSAYYKNHKLTIIPQLDDSDYEQAIDIAGDNDTLVVEAEKGHRDRRWNSFVYHIGSKEKTKIAPVHADDNVYAMTISSDASTVIGYTFPQDSKLSDLEASAFYYDVKTKEMTGLGEKTASLGSDALKYSYARDVSENGNIIVGFVDDDKDHYDGDYGDSTASYYDRKNDKMTDLGALPAVKEHYTKTKAHAVNGDGSVVIGTGIEKEDEKIHDLLVWRVSNDEASQTEGADEASPPEGAGEASPPEGAGEASPPEGAGEASPPEGAGETSPPEGAGETSPPEGAGETSPPEGAGEASPPEGAGETSPPEGAPDIAAVSVKDTKKTFIKMAEKDHDLQALARGQLDGLATMHCALEDKTYCIGVFGTANRVGHGGHLFSSGIHGALRFAPRWRAGLSLSYLANDNLPGGIKNRGRHTPGVGAYLRYAQNPDRSGLSVTASAAWQKQKLAIRRPTVGLTEPGRGDSEIKGTLLALDGAYGVKLAEGTLLSPTLGLRYLNTRRDGYQETRDASFPAAYGKSGEKSTALRVGVGLDHTLSARWSLHGDAGTRIVLDRDRDAFTAHADYIGGDVFERTGRKGRILPYANAALAVRWGGDNASLARLDVGIAKSDYGDSDAHIGVRYNYRF